MHERSPPGVRGSCWADQSRYTVCVVRRTTENSWSNATNARSGFHGKCVVKRWPNYFCTDFTGKGSYSAQARPFGPDALPSTPPTAPPQAPHTPAYPVLGMSHISRAPAALGAPPGEESFALTMGPPPAPTRERSYTDPLSALSSDSDWSSLPESKWRRLRLSFRTDASHIGWEGHCMGRNAYGDWSRYRVLPHINVLEFQAVILSLHHFLPLVRHRTVLIRTDIVTVAAYIYINKQGGTHSARLNALAAELWTWCRRRNIIPTASYNHPRPGQYNCGFSIPRPRSPLGVDSPPPGHAMILRTFGPLHVKE